LGLQQRLGPIQLVTTPFENNQTKSKSQPRQTEPIALALAADRRPVEFSAQVPP
jgi:hypothetical protein